MTDKIKKFAEENRGREVICIRNGASPHNGIIYGYCLVKPLVLIKIITNNNYAAGWLMDNDYFGHYTFTKKVNKECDRFLNFPLSEIMLIPSKDEIINLIEALEL